VSIAAVPNYLQDHDFSSASPGMRFGLLLPIWTNLQDQQAEVKKRASAKSKLGQELSKLLQEQGMEAAITLWR
jgi:CRISPR-associated protein Cmr6